MAYETPAEIAERVRRQQRTGKECPRWYVTHPEAWQNFRAQVGALLKSSKPPDNAAEKQQDKPAAEVFRVRIIDPALNIRKGAGINHDVVGVIRGGGVYTIVETRTVGKQLWGKLKSGVGWINVGEKYCKKV